MAAYLGHTVEGERSLPDSEGWCPSQPFDVEIIGKYYHIGCCRFTRLQLDKLWRGLATYYDYDVAD